eukprot:scaffold1984_cov162-Amphora_coffeaeformis.AAC.12
MVRIYRNRYQIARSFIKDFSTSCMRTGDKKNHPVVAVCPWDQAGIPNLIVASPEIWSDFTPFQRFLWYADEMEHRWYTLQRDFPKVTFWDASWETPEELEEKLQQIRIKLGLPRKESRGAPQKNHVKHIEASLNCSDFVTQDLDYRQKMQFNQSTWQILYERRPQHVDYDECKDSRSDVLAVLGDHYTTHSTEWVLPAR